MPATLWSLRMRRLSAPLRLVIFCSWIKMNAITPVSRDGGRKLNQGVIAYFLFDEQSCGAQSGVI
jgi:hypothetical protein